MALDPIKVSCDKCGTHFTQAPKRSFLGFLKVTCPKCAAKATHPLTDGYRRAYWMLLVLMFVVIFNGFSEGQFMMPGGIGIAVIFALIRDRSLRKRLGNPTPADVPNRSY